MKTLLITLITLTFAMTANAGKGDGGGAGFKVGGKYITWDRAGIKLTDKERAFDLDPETIQGIMEFTNKLPYNKALRTIAMGREGEFKLAKKVGRTLKNRIRDEYAFCFNDKDFKKKRKDFTVFAVSRTGETFLMPEFFELDPVSRAKVLIHEADVRANGFSCDTLRMDKQLSLAYEVTLGNGERSDVMISHIFEKAIELLEYVHVGIITINEFGSERKKALVADFVNRNIDFPMSLVMNEQSAVRHFDNCAALQSCLALVAKYSGGGNTNHYSREEKLSLATLPEELYNQVTQFKASVIKSDYYSRYYGSVSRHIEKAKNDPLMHKFCENRESDKPFVITSPGEDFWGRDTEIRLGKCEKKDGRIFAIPRYRLAEIKLK